MAENSEEVAGAETATEEVATEETATEVEQTEESSAETENTDTGEGEAEHEAQAATGAHVPYKRFQSVVAARNAARDELAAARAELARLTGAKDEKKQAEQAELLDIPVAPKGLNDMQRLSWYIREGLKMYGPGFIQESFGMAPAAAAANLREATAGNTERIKSMWETAAKARGLDPKSRELRTAVGALMDAHKLPNFDEAINRLFGPAKKAAAQNGNRTRTGVGAEREGIDPTAVSSVKDLPRTAADANRLAAQGKAVRHASVTEILAEMN